MSKLIITSLITLILMFSHFNEVFAVNYFITPSGCSDNYSGLSWSSPWCTLQHAANLVNPGDSVILKSGIYKQYTTFHRGGSSNAPITFMAQDGEVATLDGSNIAPNPSDPWNGKNAVLAIYANYLIFKNLEVTKSAVHGIVLTASYDSFYHVLSHDNWSNGLGGNGFYNTFEYCKFYNNKGDAANAGNVDGLAFSSGGNNTFRHNEAYNNSDDGFDMWISDHNLFEYNISHDNGWGLNGSHGDGNGFKLGGNSSTSNGGYNSVRFNVSYNNRFNGFDTNNGSNNIIYNNTAYLNYRSGSGGDFRTFNYTNTFKNNISFGNHNDLNLPYSSSNNSWDLNIIDPKFASTDSASVYFLRLTTNSPVIDKGVNVGLPYSGKAPDLGAYEYTENITSVTPTVSPRPTTISPSPTFPNYKTGDANLDSKVDGIDYSIWNTHYKLREVQSGGRTIGDFNNDTYLDGVDYVIWIMNYGK